MKPLKRDIRSDGLLRDRNRQTRAHKQKALAGFPGAPFFNVYEKESLSRLFFSSCLISSPVFLINHFHGQANLAAIIKAEKFNEDAVAFFHNVSHLVGALWGQLRDVNQTIACAKEVHESTKVNGLDDLAFVDNANFWLSGNGVDPVDRCCDGCAIGRSNLDGGRHR